MNEFVSVLRGLKLKATPQRLAVLRLLFGNHQHPSADEIFTKVKKEHPTVSRATVYNTLRALKEKALIGEIPFSNGSRFEPVSEPHINLVCVKCGRIEDFHHQFVDKLHVTVKSKAKYSIISSRLEFLGYCENCKRIRR